MVVSEPWLYYISCLSHSFYLNNVNSFTSLFPDDGGTGTLTPFTYICKLLLLVSGCTWWADCIKSGVEDDGGGDKDEKEEDSDHHLQFERFSELWRRNGW
jgi:hypothetical protein